MARYAEALLLGKNRPMAWQMRAVMAALTLGVLALAAILGGFTPREERTTPASTATKLNRRSAP